MKRYFRSLAMLLAMVLFVSPTLEVRAEGEDTYDLVEYDQFSPGGEIGLNWVSPGNGTTTEPTSEPTSTPEPTPTPEPTSTPEPTPTPEPVKELIVQFMDADGTTALRSMDVSDNDAARGTVAAALPDEECLTGWVQNGYLITGWKEAETGEVVSGTDMKDLYTKIKENKFGKAATFIAQYSAVPYEYRINYHLDYSYLSGTTQTKVLSHFYEPGKVKSTFSILDEFVLEKPVAQGYHFAGWYRDPSCLEETRVERIVGRDLIRNGRLSDVGRGLDLYVALNRVALPEAPVLNGNASSNHRDKTIDVVFTSIPANAEGVLLEVATDAGFTKNLDELELTAAEISAGRVTLYQVPKKTLYFRARAYVTDSAANRLCGGSSNALKIKATRGVTEVSASTKYGKVTSLKIEENTETGRKELKVTSTVSKRLKSGDFSYYLVRLDPRTYKAAEMLESTRKAITTGTKQTFHFTVSLYDEDGKLDMDRVNGVYAMAVRTADGDFKLISPEAYVDSPEEAYVDKTITHTPRIYVSLKDSDNIKKAINIHVEIESDTDVELSYTTDPKWQKYITKEIVKKPEGSVGAATLYYNLYNAPKNKTYYFRARTIIRDVSGNSAYGGYAYPSPAKIKVKKVKGVTRNTGLAETSIKTNRARITEARILEDPDNKNDHSKLSIKAEVYSRVKSVDGYYYLMTVDEKNEPDLFVGDPVVKMTNDAQKKQNFEFVINVSGGDVSGPDLVHIMAKYVLAVQKSKGKYARISNVAPVENPELAYADPKLPIPGQPTVDTSVKNVTKVTVPSVPDSLARGSLIQLCISKDEKFVSNMTSVDIPAGENSYTFYNLPRARYYFRVRYCVPAAYTDEYAINGLKYSSFSNYDTATISADISGVSERSAATSASSVKFVGAKKDDPEGTYRIQYTVKKRVKSYDEFYYLMKVDSSGKLSDLVDKVPKASLDSKGKLTTSQTFVFHVPLKSKSGLDINQKYALCVQSARDKYSKVSSAKCASGSSTFSVYTFKRYTDDSKKSAKITKKGMQGSTNGSQYFLNMYLDEALNGTESYTYKGKTYKFKNPWAGTVAEANKAGMMVTGQITMRYNAAKSYMLFPGTTPPAADNPNALYAIYVGNDDAKREFEAVMFYLAEKLCTEDCHIDNWVLGYETNINQVWANAGDSNNNREAFMDNYVQTFSIMHNAVRCVWRNARCYTCVERTFNDWNTGTAQGVYWGSKDFLAMFNKKLKEINSAAEWHVALHPHMVAMDKDPQPWTDANTGKYVSNTEDTQFITPANLDVFTNHIKKEYGADHRIIITEIKFTYTAGDNAQAAGLTYSYYKAEFNDMIDAFIVVMPGGVYTLKDQQAVDAYKNMDTKNWAKTNTYYKNVSGSYTSWNQVISSFNGDKFKQ